MSHMLKVISVLAESDKSWEDATNKAILLAKSSVQNIKSIYIDNYETNEGHGETVNYRINAKVSFVLNLI